jgi:hypothetical protein
MATLAPTKLSGGHRRSRTSHDDAGSPSLSSSGGSSVVGPDRMADLVRAVEQPFTMGTLLRAAERDGVAVSRALEWLRDAERTGTVHDTGERRGSRTALRGSRLYRSAP